MGIILKFGFSLLELLLALAMGLVLLLIAIPIYHHLLLENNTRRIVDQIVTAIQAARSSAIARDEVIIFCGSVDRQHCDGSWQAGQFIQSDQNQKIMRTFPALPLGDRLLWRSSLGYNQELKFAPSGFTLGQRGSFYYCPLQKPDHYGAAIVVSDSGRVRVEVDSEKLLANCG